MAELVVVGMGYVGIPVAVEFARAGMSVIGIDIVEEKVEKINAGVYPLRGQEPELPQLLKKTVAEGRLKATLDYSVCRDADFIIIAVETPINTENLEPEYKPLISALEAVAKNMKKGVLIVIESTIAPGTVETVAKPVLEKNSGMIAGEGFYLAHCPERLMVGRLLYNLRKYDRIIGGIDDKSTKIAAALYSKICHGKLHTTTALTAEVVKTVENTYRDVQIAFANEVALICEALGVDAYEVRELVNTCPYRDMHVPGAGVGGHCIPKDPWLLVYSVRGRFMPHLIIQSRQVNDHMPLHTAELAIKALQRFGVPLYDAKVCVLGAAFQGDTDDARNTPTLPLVKYLSNKGVNVVIHDPYVGKCSGIPVENQIKKAIKDADCLVVMTAHSAYKNLSVEMIKAYMRTPIVVDGRNIISSEACREHGIYYVGVGKGRKNAKTADKHDCCGR